MSTEAIRKDYTQQLLRHLQRDLNIRLNQAAAVFKQADIVLIMMDIASSIALGCEVHLVASAKHDVDPEPLLDMMETAIVERLKYNRPKVLSTAAAIRAGEKLEAAV